MVKGIEVAQNIQNSCVTDQLLSQVDFPPNEKKLVPKIACVAVSFVGVSMHRAVNRTATAVEGKKTNVKIAIVLIDFESAKAYRFILIMI